MENYIYEAIYEMQIYFHFGKQLQYMHMNTLEIVKLKELMTLCHQ